MCARPAAGLVLGPRYCGWTGLLRLDRASAVGPSESAFQVVQRQPGGPSAARWSIRGQTVHPRPDCPSAARLSIRGQTVQRQPGSPGVGVLTRARGVALDAGAPKVNGQDALDLGRGGRRHGRQPGRAWQRPDWTVGPGWSARWLGCGPGPSSKTSQPIGQGALRVWGCGRRCVLVGRVTASSLTRTQPPAFERGQAPEDGLRMVVPGGRALGREVLVLDIHGAVSSDGIAGRRVRQVPPTIRHEQPRLVRPPLEPSKQVTNRRPQHTNRRASTRTVGPAPEPSDTIRRKPPRLTASHPVPAHRAHRDVHTNHHPHTPPIHHTPKHE